MIKNKNFNKNKNKFTYKAYTLPELLVATFISTILLSFIFIFIWNILSDITDSKNEIIQFSKLYDFIFELNNSNNVYTSWSILIDNTSTWSDVFIMKDIFWNKWILIWTVKIPDYKINTDNMYYQDIVLWFRKLSWNELLEVESNPSVIYDYIFQEDQIFSTIKVKDLQFESYNSWSIYNMNLIINTNFNINMIWQNIENVPWEYFKKFNIDF